MDRIVAANVFIAIVEQGSLTGAADRLDMSRSMVTRYLAEMEGWAGMRLLHRSTRKIGLTPAGEKALAHCREIQSIAQQMRCDFEEEEAPLKGRLRISCSPSFGSDVLIPIFHTYMQRHPGVAVDLHVSNQAVNLIEERIDLAIRITNDLDPNLIARKLGDCNSAICASADYIKQYGVPKTPDALSQHNCLIYSRFDRSLWEFESNDDVMSVPVSGSLSANDPSVLLRAAEMGIGISIQPEYSVMEKIASGELIRLLPDYRAQPLGIYGIYSSRKHMSRALRLMLDLLVESLA